jgi:mRNA-degrading endonuclease RelE of RelBE toxin-antitoxin system
MEIIRSKEFIKQTKKIKDKSTKERILKQIKKIIANPECGEFLSYEKGVRKLYVPPFRLLYAYKDNKFYLLDFDHRGKIYKKNR